MDQLEDLEQTPVEDDQFNEDEFVVHQVTRTNDEEPHNELVSDGASEHSNRSFSSSNKEVTNVVDSDSFIVEKKEKKMRREKSTDGKVKRRRKKKLLLGEQTLTSEETTPMEKMEVVDDVVSIEDGTSSHSSKSSMSSLKRIQSLDPTDNVVDEMMSTDGEVMDVLNKIDDAENNQQSDAEGEEEHNRLVGQVESLPQEEVFTKREIHYSDTEITEAGELMYLGFLNETLPVMNGVIMDMTRRRNLLQRKQIILNSVNRTTSKDDEDLENQNKAIRKDRSDFAQREKMAVKCSEEVDRIIKQIDSLQESMLKKYREVDKREEGIFVEKKPYMLNFLDRMVEHRLMREEDGLNTYFNEDGHLIHEPDPTRHFFMKEEDYQYQIGECESIELKRTIPTLTISNTTKDVKLYKLDIEVEKLFFENHPLMSEEEILCMKLKQMCKTYEKLKLAATLNSHASKIRALEEELVQMRKYRDRNYIDRASSFYSTLTNDDQLNEMHKIRGELRKCRREFENEEAHRISLVNLIAKMWKRVKEVRKLNGYSTSNVKVSFIRHENNREKEEEELEHQIVQELLELEEETEWEYIQEMRRYNAHIQSSTREVILVSRPEKTILDHQQTAHQIRERILTSRRYPGEPIIDPKLDSTEIAHETAVNERERYRLVSNQIFLIEVYVNGEYLSKTKSRVMGPNFSVCFGEMMTALVLHWPESVMLKIIKKGIVNKEIASIYAAIPGLEVNIEKAAQRINFTDSSSSRWVELFQGSARIGEMTASGSLKTRLRWSAMDKDGTAEAPPRGVENGLDNEHLPTTRDLLNIERITKWMDQNNVDPNDPRNTGLLSMIEMIKNKSIESKGFYLNEQDDSLFFKDDNEAYHRRIHLLQLRHRYGDKLPLRVPIDEMDISQKVVRQYESQIRRMKKNYRTLSTHKQKVRDSIYISNNAKKLIKRNVHVSRYVNEVELPEFDNSLDWLSKFFEEKRPLKPNRIDRTTRSQHLVNECKIIVQIIRAYNIPVRRNDEEKEAYRNYRTKRMRQEEQNTLATKTGRGNESMFGGYEEPDVEKEEKDDDTNTQETLGEESSTNHHQNYYSHEIVDVPDSAQNDRVLPYIAVSFQKYTKRSKIVEGPNPQFNQSLELPFIPLNHDFSSESLKYTDDNIYIDIFDELTIDNLKDDRIVNVLSQRSEFRWLGSVSIPFQTLYLNGGSLLGTFCVNTPLIYLGYAKQQISQPTAITICITIDPPLPTPEKEESLLSSDEPSEIYHYCTWWARMAKRRKNCQNRTIGALAPNTSGKAALICRYIKEQRPPDDIDTEEKAFRFVTLIPSIDDYHLLDQEDAWMDSQEFLDIKAGDREEHAILLCNYLKYLRKDESNIYVVLGKGVPEGETAYVLTEEISKQSNNPQRHSTLKRYLLWNCYTGQRYDSTDPLCPLHEVGVVFNEHNVWACIQAEARPSHKQFNFNLDNNSSWISLIRGLNNPISQLIRENGRLPSLQTTNLKYTETTMLYQERLRENVSRAIKTSFLKWRERQGVDWNYEVSRHLKELLEVFEGAKQTNTPVSQAEHDRILKKITDSFVLVGFPLHFTFTDIRTILREVYNTMLHENDERGVQFAFAVHIHPYVNNVCSVWLYLVSLVSKRY